MTGLFSQLSLQRCWTACRFYSLRRFRPNSDLIASHADHEDKEPHMLHVVWKVRSTIRRPHWEKKIMKHYGLVKRFQPVIVKNTPEINRDLTTVRHLIRVRPLSLEQGLPNGDYEETLVTWSGQFIRKPKLEVNNRSLDSETAEQTEDIPSHREEEESPDAR